MHPQPISLPVTPVVNTAPHTNNVKQKSLLRKNRQTPAPFELNVPTPIDPTQQNRLQQFGEDLSKTFGSVATDKNVMRPNFLEEFKDFKLVIGHIHLVNYLALLNSFLYSFIYQHDPTKQKSTFKISDGEIATPTFIPTSYALDLNLTSTNGKCNCYFLFESPFLP